MYTQGVRNLNVARSSNALITRVARNIGVNRVVLALSVARMADALGNSILFLLIPLYVARLPAPRFPFPDSVLVGILISWYGLMNSSFQPFTGALIDRARRRKPFIQGGLILTATGTVAFVFARRFAHLLLIRSLQGIGVALTIPASMALMTIATKKETRGGAMGVYATMRMVGFAIGPLLGGLLQVHIGFNAAFYAGAAFMGLALVLVQLWVEDTPVPIATDSASRPSLRLLDRNLLTPGILSMGVATFLMASAFSMVTTLENEFNARLQQTALGFGVAFSALMVSRLLFQVPLGRLSDRIGRKPLIITGLLLMGPITVLLGEVRTPLEFIGMRFVQGIAAAAIAAPAFALAADLSHTGGEGRQMSIITMGFGLGIAMGPLIAGVLAVFFFELPFLVGGVMSLIGAWIVHRYTPETVRREEVR